VDLGGRVHLTEYGDPNGAEPVLCLHGLGGSALNFGLLAPQLSERRHVLVPDLLGHGRSSTPKPREATVAAQLRMISRLLAQEADRPAILIGHSMGGILALLHTLAEPSTVHRLVLLDPPVPNVTRWRRDPRLTVKLGFLRLPGVAALVARQVAGMTPEQLVDRQLADATPHVDRIAPTAIAAAVAEVRDTRLEDGGRAAQRAQFQAVLDVVALLARAAKWRGQLAGITVPTLWLQGEDDPLATAAAARVLAATRPDWTFQCRAGVGHLPHLEDPTWTTSSITRWLDDQADSR
jgi:pimeloyl-ACP methyl ester carboxylesterase